MTRFRFRVAFRRRLRAFGNRSCGRGVVALGFALAACAAPSGQPVVRIAEPQIDSAYISLHKTIRLGLERAAGAAVVVFPGVAVTNAHNANLLDPKQVIGQVGDYDLLYFRTTRTATPATGEPVNGSVVTAYGSDAKGSLRMAHGQVRDIVSCAGCTAPAYFTFSGDAGPGFSGGPVVDGSGQLVGIIFGYKGEGAARLIYAYDMARVRAEFSVVRTGRPPDVN